MKPVFFGSHATSTTFLRPSSEKLVLKTVQWNVIIKIIVIVVVSIRFITKVRQFYYKVRQVLQSAVITTKCDRTDIQIKT